MKFDSLSRIVLVATVAAALSLSAQAADGQQNHKRHHRHHHRAHVQENKGTTQMLDGQHPPPAPQPKDGPKLRRHKRLPPHHPAPGPKPTPPPA